MPLIIIFGYFGTGYFSRALSQVFTGRYNLTKYDSVSPQKVAVLTSKLYWHEAAVMYGVVGLGTILIPLSINNDITEAMALVTTFTMIFAAIISSLTITNSKELLLAAQSSG